MVSSTLQRPTLILNRNWQPVGITTVARAVVKIWNETARVVDPADYQTYSWADWAALRPAEDELVIHSSHAQFRVPEVITLLKYDRVPRNVVTFSRRNVFKRDRFTCQYCGCQPGSEELTIDHVLPRSQGGETSWENCVLACVECNSHKAARTPGQANMQLMKEPVRPKWKPFYALQNIQVDSWSRFISENYWNVELER
ncbi:HNH endonuclease [Gimesia panareensis]|uniref:CRISPR-associated endonuclease Cas9 n=1 Tax=Gimesia panareensis TaxID=2527978 RepID=A0A518A6U4_9PLAN|nr:HNH endonuclease [Gimesia panareensis]QDT26642.1 CRISPR-associated endonuclease Cas9 [Gimesia panareensis]QDU50452.1 CRISPR-associated endonuclease Cas9 [Gimesia panareensis]